MILEVFKRIKFWKNADRIGPDIIWTHWRLYFKSSMKKLCKKKFKKFGENSEFRPGAYAEACSKILIGDNVIIRPGSYIYADPSECGGEIIIEDNVLLGGSVHIYTNNHKFSDINLPISQQGYPPPSGSDSVKIKNGAWIGAGTIILPGVEIGSNSVVGAGSVVTKSIPDFRVYAGNPAKLIRSLE